MSAFKEFANFIALNMANLAATYARLLVENSKDYSAFSPDSRTASARRLLKAVVEAYELQSPEPLLLLFNHNNNHRWKENIVPPQPLVEVECLGQTLTPVVTNLEAGKFLWQLLSEVRQLILVDVPLAADNIAERNQAVLSPNRGERSQSQAEFSREELRYQALFEDSPISLWEEDFSDVKHHLDRLRESGITDFRGYFETQPEAVVECARMVKIIDVNQATLDLYKASSKEGFFAGLAQVFGPESVGAFKQELIAITEGQNRLEIEAINYTLAGERKYLDLTWAVAPSYEDSLARVLVSIIDITEQKQAEAALREGEARYRGLFEDSPISLWEEDFSDVKAYLDRLSQEGVTDFRAYFEAHPEVVDHCASLVKIVGVNRATLELFNAQTTEEFLGGLNQIFGPETFGVFQEELTTLAEGKSRFESEGTNYTLTGEKKDIVLRAFIAPGHEERWTKVLITMIDISERKRLEQQVQESLSRRTLQVETSTVIAQEIALTPALDDLFHRIVSLVQERFGYYHAHIYALQDITLPGYVSTGETYLVMQEGTGDAGRQMKAAGHKISLSAEQSLVARAARSGEAVLVPDVSQTPSWLPNPLLPETKAELAVPIKLGRVVLGVLDVQNNIVGSLTEEDQLLLIGLCGQIAVAMNNRYAESEREELLAQVEQRAHREQTVREITEKMRSASSLEELIRVTARELGQRFSADYALIELGLETSPSSTDQPGNGHHR